MTKKVSRGVPGGRSEASKSSNRKMKVTEAQLTCDVLEENKWDVSLAAQFDEMCPLERDTTDQRLSFSNRATDTARRISARLESEKHNV